MGEDRNSGLHAMMQESPFDTKVARGVKRAYSSLDKLSWRIGATLRRYPIARIFVIAYMVRNWTLKFEAT